MQSKHTPNKDAQKAANAFHRQFENYAEDRNKLCFTDCPEDTNHEDEFSERDVLYSNQGDAGTCVRHAVAKALQMLIGKHSKYQFHTMSLVSFLVLKKPMGPNGMWPTHLDGVKGRVNGRHGMLFDLEFNVEEV